MASLLKDAVQFVRKEKKWIIIPLVVLLILAVAAVFLLSSGSGISWALYPK
jgi:hypothetical protein